jgi:uncharacterized protein (TIGR03083 family)
MGIDDVWRAIDAERSGLADLLDDLTPAEWAAPSLCAGWRVRDVAAHLTLAHMPPAPAVLAALRARGSFDRMVHDTAVRQAALPCEEFPHRLRAMAGSRRKAPFVTPLEPLLDVLVHGQDIARPLGRHRPMPTGAAAAAADRVWSMGWPFHAQRRLRGLWLSATDAAWSVGDGLAVEGPISALLLLMTGREAAVDELTGRGVGALAGGTNASRRTR